MRLSPFSIFVWQNIPSRLNPRQRTLGRQADVVPRSGTELPPSAMPTAHVTVTTAAKNIPHIVFIVPVIDVVLSLRRIICPLSHSALRHAMGTALWQFGRIIPKSSPSTKSTLGNYFSILGKGESATNDLCEVKKLSKWNYRVEVSVRGHKWGEMSVIDKRSL
jgi:hypothetical protein